MSITNRYLPAPSASTLDSASYATSSTCWDTPHRSRISTRSTHPPMRRDGRNSPQTSVRTISSGGSNSPAADDASLESTVTMPVAPSSTMRLQTAATSEQTDNDASERHDDIHRKSNTSRHGTHSEVIGQSTAIAFQNLLMSRRTVAFNKASKDGRSSFAKETLLEALERAVRCAQMAPNHKRTEPFSFRRFLAGSKAANDLAEISYQVTMRKHGSEPDAQAKRKKWLEIPGYLVMLVHENQSADESSSVPGREDYFEALPYSPPETERQLEDVSDTARLSLSRTNGIHHLLFIALIVTFLSPDYR